MRWFVVIGGAALVAFGLVSLVPVLSTEASEQFVVASDHQIEGEPLCGSIELSGTLTAQVRRPVLDLWNVGGVHGATVSDYTVSTRSYDECEGQVPLDPGTSSMSTYVLISNPTCAEPNAVDEGFNESDHGTHYRCDDRAVALTMRHHDPTSMTLSSESALDLGSDGFRHLGSQWCLDVQMGAEFTVGSSTYLGPVPESMTGDGCLALD